MVKATNTLTTKKPIPKYLVISFNRSSNPGFPLKEEVIWPPMVPLNPSLLVVCMETINIKPKANKTCTMLNNMLIIFKFHLLS